MSTDLEEGNTTFHMTCTEDVRTGAFWEISLFKNEEQWQQTTCHGQTKGGGNDGAVGVSVFLVSVLFLSLLQKEFPIRKITEIKFLLHGRSNLSRFPTSRCPGEGGK